MKKKTPPKPMYQNCLITTDDGQEHVFTGKAFASSKDKRTQTIKNIVFTEPRELPEGYTFESQEVMK